MKNLEPGLLFSMKGPDGKEKATRTRRLMTRLPPPVNQLLMVQMMFIIFRSLNGGSSEKIGKIQRTQPEMEDRLS